MTAEQVHSAVARIVNLYGDVVKTDTWIDARIRSSAKVS
jgi:hypothetical protein